MAGYGLNTPKYGYLKPGGGGASSPYYRVAAANRDLNLFSPQQGTDLFQSPLLGSAPAAPRISQYNAPTSESAPAAEGAVAPAAPQTKPGAAAAAAQPQGPVSLAYDYKTDPILQQIQAVSVQSRQGADTSALALKKQLATRYGDHEFARNVLHDDLTAEAAQQNPYSVFAQLHKNQELDANQLDENLNKQNLFYGGARINQQGHLADQYGQQQAAETANEQDAIGAIDSNRLAAYLGADASDRQAEQDAYMRQLQAALASGYSAASVPQDAGGDAAPQIADKNADPTAAAEARGGGGIAPLNQILSEIAPAGRQHGNQQDAKTALSALSLFQTMAGNPLAPQGTKKQTASARAALNDLAKALAH